MVVDKITLGGLILAALGWGFILTFPMLLQPENAKLIDTFTHSNTTFIERVAEKLIITGFAVALLGALHSSVKRNIRAQSVQKSRVPVHDAPPTAGETTLIDSEEPMHGDLNGRAFVKLPDGTVEVDTLLGRRKFQSLSDAIAFIGA